MSQKLLALACQKIQVMQFLDYRDYLRSLFLYLKSRESPYSYLIFAEDLGFSRTNVLRLVISAKRKLSDGSAQIIVKALNLKRAERRYFIALVKYNNAVSQERQEQFFEELSLLKMENASSEGDKKRMEYYSEWYFPLVRELIRAQNDLPTQDWLQSNLYAKIFPEQVRKATELLNRLGLVSTDQLTGKISSSSDEPMVLIGDQTAGEISLIKYHQEMMTLAHQALVQVPHQEREFNALTLTLSQEGFHALQEKIQNLCAEALQLENQQMQKESLVQLNIQFFSLTKRN